MMWLDIKTALNLCLFILLLDIAPRSLGYYQLILVEHFNCLIAFYVSSSLCISGINSSKSKDLILICGINNLV